MEKLIIYDKPKYHYEGDFPGSLDQVQAYVHIGMFLGWLCDMGLLSEIFCDDFRPEINQYLKREITGAKLLRLVGGSLVSDMLSDVGNHFTEKYYASCHYIDDYIDTLAASLPSMYHVQDTWENYAKLRERLSQRYERGADPESTP
jgi:hypothetical protein